MARLSRQEIIVLSRTSGSAAGADLRGARLRASEFTRARTVGLRADAETARLLGA